MKKRRMKEGEFSKGGDLVTTTFYERERRVPCLRDREIDPRYRRGSERDGRGSEEDRRRGVSPRRKGEFRTEERESSVVERLPEETRPVPSENTSRHRSTSARGRVSLACLRGCRSLRVPRSSFVNPRLGLSPRCTLHTGESAMLPNIAEFTAVPRTSGPSGDRHVSLDLRLPEESGRM